MGLLNLNRCKLRVLEAGDKIDQKREARLILPEIVSERASLMERAKQVRIQFSKEYLLRFRDDGEDVGDPAPVQREERIAAVLRFGTWAVASLDIGLSANLAVSWLQMSEWPAAVAGGAGATLLSYGAKASFSAVLGDSKQPLKARRQLKAASGIAIMANALLLWFLFATRSPSQSLVDLLTNFGGVLLGMVALSLPALAGCLWALAENYGWSKPLAKEFQANTARRAKLLGFENWLRFDILQEPPPPPPPHAASSLKPTQEPLPTHPNGVVEEVSAI
jgi:hypothetical protein